MSLFTADETPAGQTRSPSTGLPRSPSALPRSPRPALLSALAMARGPERFFDDCLARRGDPFSVGFPGIGDVFFTGHPDGAREIFSAPPGTFEPLAPNPVEPLLGAGSLILLAGERHRRERKLMTPPFHGDRMRAYGEVIRERALAGTRHLRAGTAFSAGELARTITLEVIAHAVFGVSDDARRARFRESMLAFLERYTTPLVVLPLLRRSFFGLGPYARFARAREAFHALLREEIAARRRGILGDDVLSLLVSARYEDGSSLRDDELVDELSTLLVAGHETTTTALAWALHYTLATPAIEARVLAELAGLGPSPSPEAIAELPYLSALCSEALRLHPVVPIVVRRVAAPLSFRGLDVPVGAGVAVALTLLHKHPSVWDEPLRFSPERFLDRKYGPHEYAPFGGGARRCIGAAFATYEMKLILGTLLSRYRLELAPHAPREVVLYSITMGPRAPIRVICRGSRA